MEQNKQTLRKTKKTSEEEAITRRADWLAWVAQLIVGFVLGAAIGLYLSRIFVGRHDWTDRFLIAIGIGLICGAVASYHGNRAWMSRHIFLAPESPPPPTARSCSKYLAAIGVAVVFLTIKNHFAEVAAQDRSSHSPGFAVFMLVFALIPGYLALRAIRTGDTFWLSGDINRYDTPLHFWLYVMCNALACLGIVLKAIFR